MTPKNPKPKNNNKKQQKTTKKPEISQNMYVFTPLKQNVNPFLDLMLGSLKRTFKLQEKKRSYLKML